MTPDIYAAPQLLQCIDRMIEELAVAARMGLPFHDDKSKLIYAEFTVDQRIYGITHIMLSIKPVPTHLPNYKGRLYLELSTYKLPCPYKSTIYIFTGNAEQLLKHLESPAVRQKILQILPQLADYLSDV